MAGINEMSLLNVVDTAVAMNQNENFGIPISDYMEKKLSSKVVKVIQSYTRIVARIVWKKEQ